MDRFVTVATFSFAAEADFMRRLLEDAGITVYLADDNLIAMDWFLSNAVGGVKVQVAAKDAAQATALIHQHESVRKHKDPAIVQFPCESCGRHLEFPGERRGGVETCRYCGSYVDVPE